VFVAYGLPGEEVDVLIERAFPDYLEGVVTAVHTPSPHRITPRCEYFGVCGGCQLQHAEYGEQLRLKTEIVREQMRRIRPLPDLPLLPAVSPGNPTSYRNHARLSVGLGGYLGFVMRVRNGVLRI